MGGAALMVSGISLYVAVHHGQTMEKLVEANSFPNIEVTTTVGQSALPENVVFKITVENTGVGPARVETVELWDAGKPMISPDQIIHAIEVSGDGRPLAAGVSGETVIGSLLGVGKSRNVVALEMQSPTWDASAARFLTRFRSRVCYCSVFDECYITDSKKDRGRPAYVKKCPVVSSAYEDGMASVLTHVGADKP